MGNQTSQKVLETLPFQIGEQLYTTPIWKVHDGTRKKQNTSQISKFTEKFSGATSNISSVTSNITSFTSFFRKKEEQSAIVTEAVEQPEKPSDILISDGEDDKVTIFVHEAMQINQLQSDYAKTCFKRLKVLRHPGIVTYLDGMELDGSIYIVTEHVQPLENALKAMQLENGLNHWISWGFYNVAKTLKFLHSNNLYHGSINSKSIYVTKNGDWKIGELGFVSTLTPSTPIDENLPLKKYFTFFEPLTLSPELTNQNWDLIKESPEQSLDCWGLAVLIYEVFHGRVKDATLKNATKVPEMLKKNFLKLITQNPTARQKIVQFMKSDFFNNFMIETQNFLEQITLKDKDTTERFLIQLPDFIADFPKNNLKYHVLPELIKALKFGYVGNTGSGNAIIPIFKIATNIMPESEYKSKFIPEILELFTTFNEKQEDTAANNDPSYNIFSVSGKVALLQNLKFVIPFLNNESDIKTKIYPSLASGFNSTYPAVREATVKAMVEIVPKLDGVLIEDSVIPCLWKLQTDPQAGIRTNVIICFAKLAQYLTARVRQKTLGVAFTRAMRDPFVHTRIAALKGLMASKQFFDVVEVATKIIPGLTPMCVDLEKDVRNTAFQALQSFLKLLSDSSKNPNFEDEIRGCLNQTKAINSSSSSSTSSSSSSSGSGASGTTPGQDSAVDASKKLVNWISAKIPGVSNIVGNSDDVSGRIGTFGTGKLETSKLVQAANSQKESSEASTAALATTKLDELRKKTEKEDIYSNSNEYEKYEKKILKNRGKVNDADEAFEDLDNDDEEIDLEKAFNRKKDSGKSTNAKSKGKNVNADEDDDNEGDEFMEEFEQDKKKTQTKTPSVPQKESPKTTTKAPKAQDFAASLLKSTKKTSSIKTKSALDEEIEEVEEKKTKEKEKDKESPKVKKGKPAKDKKGWSVDVDSIFEDGGEADKTTSTNKKESKPASNKEKSKEWIDWEEFD